MNAPIDWLLGGDPWIEYRTRVDLLDQAESDREVRSSRESMLEDTKINRSAEGPFQLPMNIPSEYGGTGTDQWAWALCDAPLIVYALIKFGLGSAPEVQSALGHLTGLLRDNGWPCAVSKEIAPFRGPGRKADPCPFANLAMLKALSESVPLSSGDKYRPYVSTWLEPVRALVNPVSEGHFAGALDISKVPSFGDRLKFRLSVIFGVWSEGDHRDWNAIRAWTDSIHPLLQKY